MAKPNIQDILLKKGDKIALGVGAALVGGLSLWGVADFATADSPRSLVTQFDNKAGSLKQSVAAEGTDAAELPAWVMKGADKVPIDPAQFPLAGSPFETVDRPDTLRNNPKVLCIDDAMFDYIRFPMRADDLRIGPDGSVIFGVKVAAAKSDMSSAQVRQNLADIDRRNKVKPPPLVRTPTPPPQGGGGAYPPGVGGPPGGNSGRPPGGMQPGASGRGGPGGMPGGPGGMPGGMGDGGGYGAGDRNDQTVRLASIAEVTKDNLTIAETVYPLRAVVVTATFPIKKQIEEIRQALRARSNEDAKVLASVGGSIGPVFAGFEVDRQTRFGRGEWTEWTPYDHTAEYLSKISSRAKETVSDAGYLSYFVPPPDQKMVYPLPMYADGLGEYRKISMRAVVDQIDKLNKLNAPKPTQSELLKRATGQGGTDFNPFAPQGAAGTNAGGGMPGLPGGSGMGIPPGYGQPGMTPGRPTGPPTMPGAAAGPGMPTGGTLSNQQNPLDEIVEHSLLRFIDSDVQPGFSYQYRVKVKLKNPNFGKPKEVSKPADAKVEVLEGPWMAIPEVFTVPTDSYLYAHDSAEYTEASTKLVEKYGKEPMFKKFLEVEEVSAGRRAIVEMHEWRERILLDGEKKEPVGTWVIAKVPVAPGEYIGKRQFVELPLWSGGLGNYVLRELAGGLRVAGIKDPKHQPKGWPLNLRPASPSLLIDFEGGKVRPRVNDREVADASDSELLILQPDGKLVVRNSGADTIDRDRKSRDTVWTEWVNRVRDRSDVTLPQPGVPGGVPGGGFGKPGG